MTNDKMMEILAHAVDNLLVFTEDKSRWSSLIVNRRKPWTYRAFTNFDYEGQNFRMCLHRFATCDEHESFLHPHPWPGAFLIVQGSYLMGVGTSPDRFSKPTEAAKFLMNQGSRYSIVNPLTWHSVTPLTECHTIMVNGEPWDSETAHTDVRTTKGKDLDSMSDEDLSVHLGVFRNWATEDT